MRMPPWRLESSGRCHRLRARLTSWPTDYGMADVSSVVQGIAKGAKVKAFMVYTDITTNGLASLTPYPTPESVVGKKIAASQANGEAQVAALDGGGGRSAYALRNLPACGLIWLLS